MSNKTMKWSVLLIIVCFVSANAAFGWWSMSTTSISDTDTHEKLSKEILGSGYISETEYPDIHKFSDPIWGATEGTADDADAHDGDSGSDDGPADIWWDIALQKYSEGKFSQTRGLVQDARTVAGAYWHIGKMLHLVEDMGVPAHAFDVYHAGAGVDNFESNADTNYSREFTYFTPPSGKEPFVYKEDLRTRTKNKLKDNPSVSPSVSPPSSVIVCDKFSFPLGTKWSYFWIERTPPYPRVEPYKGCSIEDDGAECKGSYGTETFGNSGLTVLRAGFARSSTCSTTSENNLVRHQLADARSFGKAALEAASESLPPLLRSLEVSPSASSQPVIDLTNGTDITVNVWENRTRNVKLFINVDSSSITSTSSLVDIAGFDCQLSTGTELPWQGTCTRKWNGKLANGSYPSPGVHTLAVYVKDGDGNPSDIKIHDFVIPAMPAAISNPVNGTILTSGTVTFTWNNVGASQYWLYVGTLIGGSDIYNASQGTNTSATVSNLPTNGSAIYVRLWSNLSGSWRYNEYIYKAVPGGNLPGAVSVNPAGGVWTASPQNIAVSSSGATAIYYKMSNTYDGSTPSVPSDPSNSSYQGSIIGASGNFSYYGSSGQIKKTYIKFRGCNAYGCGPISQTYSYSIDLRTTPSIPTALTSGSAVSGSAAYQGWKYYTITTASSDTQLKVELYGLSADIDLYVKKGSQPTTSGYDCKSDASGTTSELCTMTNSGVNTWYIGVYGYAAGSYTLKATSSGTVTSLPGTPSVSPPNGNWTVSPQSLSVSSSGATKIYYRMVNTYDGSTPSVPSDPSFSAYDGSITGSSGSFSYYGSSGQIKKTYIKFRGCNAQGCGTVSQAYYYSIDLRTGSATSYALTVAKTGSGTVTSGTAGVSCGTDCTENYASGTSVTLTATPTTGYTFGGWSGACTGTGVCTITMNAAKSVTATFNANVTTYALTVSKTGSGTVASSSAGISCGTDCTENYTSGSSVTLTAAPASGYTFGGWSGACTGTGVCMVTMNAAKSVTAAFNANVTTYALTVSKTGSGTVTSSTAGISCGTDCTESYVSGASVTLTAAPAIGYTFGGWSGACTGTGVCTVTMNAAKSVTAAFNAIPTTYTLSLSKAGNGSGTVSSNIGNINCGSASCSYSYTSGQSVTLTASPAAGSSFTGWSGDCYGTGICTLPMNDARNVTATFSISQYTFTVTKAGTGSGTVTSSPAGINCGTTCSYPFSPTTRAVLTAVASSGSVFAGWSGDTCSGTGTCALNTDRTINVTATFNVANTNPNPSMFYDGQTGSTLFLTLVPGIGGYRKGQSVEIQYGFMNANKPCETRDGTTMSLMLRKGAIGSTIIPIKACNNGTDYRGVISWTIPTTLENGNDYWFYYSYDYRPTSPYYEDRVLYSIITPNFTISQ